MCACVPASVLLTLALLATTTWRHHSLVLALEFFSPLEPLISSLTLDLFLQLLFRQTAQTLRI